jgi:DNA-binding transcriptional regulator YdaS (Cro superfamily)
MIVASCGTQAELARRLGVRPMTVSQWKERGIPPKWVLPIERATGGQVSRHVMRPDIYPIEKITNTAA